MPELAFNRQGWFQGARLNVTRGNGDQVYLSYKQLAMILVACITPAITFGGFLYHFNERLTVVETRQRMNEDRIQDNRVSIDKLNNHSATLQRIEQQVTDVARRVERMENRIEVGHKP